MREGVCILRVRATLSVRYHCKKMRKLTFATQSEGLLLIASVSAISVPPRDEWSNGDDPCGLHDGSTRVLEAEAETV